MKSAGLILGSPNTEFDLWIIKDQLIISSLLSSLSTMILWSLTRVWTLAGVWSALEKIFAIRSQARMMPLKMQFQTSKIGNADDLYLIGCEISGEDLTLSILVRFLLEFDVLVARFNDKLQWNEVEYQGSNLTIRKVLAMEVVQETRIDQMIEQSNANAIVSLGVMVNYTNTRGRGRACGIGGGDSHNSGGRGNNNSHPPFQICNKHVRAPTWWVLQTVLAST